MTNSVRSRIIDEKKDFVNAQSPEFRINWVGYEMYWFGKRD